MAGLPRQVEQAGSKRSNSRKGRRAEGELFGNRFRLKDLSDLRSSHFSQTPRVCKVSPPVAGSLRDPVVCACALVTGFELRPRGKRQCAARAREAGRACRAGPERPRGGGVHAKCPGSLQSGRGTGAQGGAHKRAVALSFVCRVGFEQLIQDVEPSAPGAEKAGRGTLPTTPAQRMRLPRAILPAANSR